LVDRRIRLEVARAAGTGVRSAARGRHARDEDRSVLRPRSRGDAGGDARSRREIMSAPEAVAGLSSEAKRKLLTELLQKRQSESVWYPLTEGQKGLWVQYRLAPESSAYISVFCVRIRSMLDAAALKSAFQS